MSLSEQNKQQFEELLKPLVSSVAELKKSNENLTILITDIKSDLVGSIEIQGEEIAKLHVQVNDLSTKNNNLVQALAECDNKFVTNESQVISRTTLETRLQEIEIQLAEKNKYSERIIAMESQLAMKENDIKQLQQNIFETQRYHRETIVFLENRCDNLEQYGRRPSLRLDGIPPVKNESLEEFGRGSC